VKVEAKNVRGSDWDPLAEEAVEDPVATHAELRARCPVAHSERWGGFWTLTRYEDICAAARDTETFSSAVQPIPPMDFGQDGPLGIPIELDPPETKKYRQLLGPYFGPRHLERMAAESRELVIGFLEPIVQRGHGELVGELTNPYPSNVLCQCLLKAPRRDWSRLKDLTLGVLKASVDGDSDAVATVGGELDAYVAELVRKRREEPLDPAVDMISGLLVAEVDGRPLDDATIAGIMRLMAIAGHDTTSNALANAILHLARNREDQDRLREQPSLIPVAIEELLRLYPPVQQLARRATRDVELHGRTIQEGESVGLLWISGNHDEDAFTDPERCLIERQPNRHLTFGIGVHHCLGAPLARSELRVALEELLARTSGFELDGDTGGWLTLPAFGPKSLPIRVTNR
jgi:cytochrome P450